MPSRHQHIDRVFACMMMFYDASSPAFNLLSWVVQVAMNIYVYFKDDPSRYISLLAEIFKRNNGDLIGKAVQLFPRSLNLSKVEFSWNTTDAFCEVLRKQSEEIRSLKLCSCFSDIGRIISAIIEMPGKVGVVVSKCCFH